MDIATLAAFEAIREVKYRYFHALDSKDWDAFGALFAEDAVTDYSEAAPVGMTPSAPAFGRSAIVKHVSGSVQSWLTVHHGFSPLIEVVGPDDATAKWMMDDQLYRREEGAWKKFLHGFGTYHERYARREGRWLYTYIKLTRHHIDLF